MIAAGAMIFGSVIMTSCTTDPDSPGVEYMPDMYRSPAVEAYVDYGFIRETENPELKVKLSSKVPPKNTIAYHADPQEAAVFMPYNRPAPNGFDKTHGLYGWDIQKKGDQNPYEAAAQDKNPININQENADQILSEAEELYVKFCTHCHGEEGKGKGSIGSAGLLNVPAYNSGSVKDLKEGQVFFSITYGKGAMGAHAMMLDKEERWLLTHYVKMLQNDGTYPFEATESAPVDTVASMDSTAMAQNPQ